MKRLIGLFTLFLCLIFTESIAQKSGQCSQCNMNMNDDKHIATATYNGEELFFGSIECLVNHLKDNALKSLSYMMVSDYDTGKMIPAEDATYLISKAIPSPMGANLSAFRTEDAVRQKAPWKKILF